MSHSRANHAGQTRKRRSGELAGARTTLLLAVVFLLGIGLSAVWFYASSKRGQASANEESSGTPVILLSDATRTVLSRLDSPV